MSKKNLYILALIISLLGILIFSVEIKNVHAPHLIITIEADGSISPTPTNITTSDNITYTFTADINASIIIQRSNIVIDGNGWTLNGVDFTIMRGFNLTGVSNVTIKNINILEFGYAVWLEGASQCVISNNTCTTNEGGIWLVSSTENTVSNNNITGSFEAVALDSFSYDNTISNNTLVESYYGVYVRNCSVNLIWGNKISETHSGIYTLNSNVNAILKNEMTNNWLGIDVSASSNNTLSGNNVTDNTVGIRAGSALINSKLVKSTNNTILENYIVNSTNGIDAVGVLFTTISRNHIAENSQYGIAIDNVRNSIISANTIVDNFLGLYYDGLCNNNTAYHNNFIGNVKHVEVSPGDINAWDDGFEGNYWSNFKGSDLDADGIMDTPYIMDVNNTDRYPLMGLFSSFNTSLGTRVAIPHEVLPSPYNVTVEGATPTYWNYSIYDNGTHRWIYFEYEHSTKEIVIIPEYSALVILPLFMITILLGAFVYRRKHFT
jgi:parallel beta-helix repeat protein